MQQKITLSDIKFHPHSFGDRTVRLFRLDGEIYRAIKGERAAFFKNLFETGLIQRLIEKGLLIVSELTTLKRENYDLVPLHRMIRFNSYPNEWCAAMLKDGMLTMLDLASELARHGLTLGDAHPWNLMFDTEKNRPVFVDLGSIIPLDSSVWSVYDEFCRFCFYPLILMANDLDEIARLLMFEDRGVVKSDVVELVGKSSLTQKEIRVGLFGLIESKLRQQIVKLPDSYRQKIKQYLLRIENIVASKNNENLNSSVTIENIKQKSHSEFLQTIRKAVNNIDLNWQKNEFFSVEIVPSFFPDSSWTETQKSIYQILTERKPTSVLDISYQPGWYAQLAATLGSQTISFDTDRNWTTQLYFDSLEKKIPLLPLVMDFTKTTPARGLGNHWSIAAGDRLACDLVLALGIVDRMVRQRRLNFEQIVEGFALFSQQWLIVEFAGEENTEISQWRSDEFHWYTLENFISALRQEFRQVDILEPASQASVLLVCQK